MADLDSILLELGHIPPGYPATRQSIDATPRAKAEICTSDAADIPATQVSAILRPCPIPRAMTIIRRSSRAHRFVVCRDLRSHRHHRCLMPRE